MLNPELLITALTVLTGQPQPWPPDMSDLLRGADSRPNVDLVLDTSCSMSGGDIVTPCAFYTADTGRDSGGTPANPRLNKAQMLEAALTGCRSATDGVLDVWDKRVNFAMRFFADDHRLMSPFVEITTDAQHDAFEDVALLASQGLGGATHMTRALANAGRDFRNLIADSPGTVTYAGASRQQLGTRTCRKNFVLFLSDGNPNGGGETGDSACNGNTSGGLGAGDSEFMARYLNGNLGAAPDHLCSAVGDQTIGSYALGFGAAGSFDPDNLEDIADYGGGEYFYAANVDGLNRAFELIILSIVQRSTVFGGGGTVQRQGLFAGGINFLASYRTSDSSWVGNLKKYCVLPPRTGTDSRGRPVYAHVTTRLTAPGPSPATDCQFYAYRLQAGDVGYDAADNQKQVLLPNPFPRDMFCTGPCGAPDQTSLDSDRGGAGDILNRRLIAGMAASSGARNLLTYFPGVTGLIELDRDARVSNPDVNPENMWVADGETWRIINRLNGYSRDASLSTGEPVAPGRWPLGDPVNTNPVLVRYSSDCDVAPGCVVVIPTNNGIVHFIQAADGNELAALVPGEFWRPSELNHFLLGDLENQPAPDVARRHYLDGPAQLFHDDVDGDGVVESAMGDRAYLIFNAGRGGRITYLMDVSSEFSVGPGFLPNVHPLGGGFANSFRQLRDTWANPWLGKIVFDTAKRRVGVFSSGHVPELDRHTSNMPGTIPDNLPDYTTDYIPCRGAGGMAAAAGFTDDVCALGPVFSPIMVDMTIGPFFMPGSDIIAYQAVFNSLTIDAPSGSFLAIEDSLRRAANVVTGVGGSAVPATHPLSQPLSGGVSGWIYGNDISFRGHIEAFTTAGFDLAGFNVRRRAARGTTEHYPSVYIVDLDAWAASTPYNADVSMPVWAHFTRACGPGNGYSNCVDASLLAARDLEHMTCPVSTEVSVVNFNSELRLYWGDECGQLWAAVNGDPDHDHLQWRVRRLAHMSTTAGSAPDMSNQNTALSTSNNVRKVFRRLDVVASTCPGRRVYGVYFGTGDIQRPLALADHTAAPEDRYLQDGGVATQFTVAGRTGGRDVVGVVFDNGTTQNVVLSDLYNATADPSVSRTDLASAGYNGWFFYLRPHEKMLRDPLVFQNVVYYKSFTPTSIATECVNATGFETNYAMNNCTAEAIGDFNGTVGIQTGDRVIGTSNEDIGPDPYLLTTVDGPPIVVMSSAVNTDVQTGMSTHQRAASARPRIYNWRLPR